MKISFFYMFSVFSVIRSFHNPNFLRNTKRSLSIQKNPLSYKKKSNDGFDLMSSVSKSNIRHISPSYIPKTENQKLYVELLNNNNASIVVSTGPAGCGKTLFACITAIQQLMSGNIQKIILTRPIVSVEEEEIGFLPGNLINKMDPWTRPIFDILLEFYQQKDLDLMLNSGVIEISPLAYMRGRTFKRSFIIADEMQNSSPNQMLMLSTRIGEKSKLVITGDLKQSDRSNTNGLLDIMNKIRFYNNMKNDSMIRLIEMNESDVRRSLVVSQILDMYKMNFSDTTTTAAAKEVSAIIKKQLTIYGDCAL